MTIPRTIDDITPEWLSDALGRSVTRVTKEPVGVGVGLVGQLFRLQMEGGAEPSTVIAKLAAPTDEGRFVATVLNMYGREVGFYTRAVGTHVDRASGLLLRRARPGDAGHGAAARGRLGARTRRRPGGRLLARRGARRDPHPRPVARLLLGRPVAGVVVVPPAAGRRSVSGRGRDGVRDGVAARAGALRRHDRRPGPRLRRQLRHAHPRAVRQAVRRPARAVARRLAARQSLLHRRRTT